MSMFSTTDAGGDVASPQGVFINGPKGLVQLKVDVSAWASSDFLVDGYLLPGTPLRLVSGLLVPVDNTSQVANFCNADSVELGSADHDIGVASAGEINQDVLEDLIGRVLSANELAAIAANDRFVLV